MRATGIAVCVAGLAGGLATEYLAFDWDDPLIRLPDLAVGLTMIGAGATAATRSRGAGVLLVAAGFAWFVGTLFPVAVYWHRGPLIHLLTTYPGARLRSRGEGAVVLAGYTSAIAEPLWRQDVSSVALASVGLGLAVASHRRASGRRRRDRLIALEVAAALSGAILVGAVVRLLVTPRDAVSVLLLGYEVVLIVATVSLVVGLRPPAVTRVADLVVELGEGRSDMLREAFADALRDPTVQFGYWEPARSAFVDSCGAVVAAPVAGDGRAMTTIERDGRPLAALVHDAAVLTDPSLAQAVAATARLTAAHADLEAVVRGRIDEVAASARRVQIATDEERSRLEQRLAAGPEASLREVLRTLNALPTPQGHQQRAIAQLDRTVSELHDIARGLHPRELDGGLASALTEMAARSPVPVRLAVYPNRLAWEIEAATYYLCAEALANATKHAGATVISIEVTTDAGIVAITVTDDGIGGANPAAGTGLAGLTDRVAALGGRLKVTSPPDGGTRLAAEIPVESG